MHRQVSVIYEGVDADTPQDVKLSAKYTKSFAYHTVKDRLPVILTKVIDTLSTNKKKILADGNEGGEEDLKSVIGKVSKLKNELVTNKCFINLCSNGEDVEEWNKYLESQINSEEPPCWYYSPWLYAECYMYRRLREIFENSETLQDYDHFFIEKENAFEASLCDIKIVGKYVLNTLPLNGFSNSDESSLSSFIKFLKLSLWSNRCDLSLSNAAALPEETIDLRNIIELDSFVLCDDSEKVFDLLKNCQKGIIDFVHDNSSYEVFCDFCFCDYLCSSLLAKQIRFHVKKMPWFVSDVTKKDVNWLLDKLETVGLEKLSGRWRKYFQEGVWAISEEKYWTLPFDYSDMKMRDPTLYSKLQTSDLVIFKGDLNYRKLLGDINWDHFEKFDVALREFKPTNILSLRTVKADLICGLSPEKCEHFKDKMWMRTGEYAVIQLCTNV